MAIRREVIHAAKKGIEDCEIVFVEEVRYRNVMELLYEESKYKKTYPKSEEWDKDSLRRQRQELSEARYKLMNPDEYKRNNAQPYTKEQLELMVKLNKDGKTYQEIAKEVGRPKQSISTKLSQMRKLGLVD